jgi:hypothetical protein
VFDHRHRVQRVTVQEGCRALGEVDLETGGAAKQQQDLFDGDDIIRRGVAEQDHVVSIQGECGDMASRV